VVEEAFTNVDEQPLLDQVLLDQVLHEGIIARRGRNRELARVFVKENPFIGRGRHGIAEFMTRLYAGLSELVDRANVRSEMKRDVHH
jgi:hypothetical protein